MLVSTNFFPKASTAFFAASYARMRAERGGSYETNTKRMRFYRHFGDAHRLYSSFFDRAAGCGHEMDLSCFIHRAGNDAVLHVHHVA